MSATTIYKWIPSSNVKATWFGSIHLLRIPRLFFRVITEKSMRALSEFETRRESDFEWDLLTVVEPNLALDFVLDFETILEVDRLLWVCTLFFEIEVHPTATKIAQASIKSQINALIDPSFSLIAYYWTFILKFGYNLIGICICICRAIEHRIRIYMRKASC
jgi:hypothetical protein